MIPKGFLPIPGYTKYYINNKGLVWRIGGKDGFCIRKGRCLTPTENKNRWGYMYISLQEEGIKRKNWTLHRLVAITFIPNPENKPQVNHIDGNKKNNCSSNLEWVTDKENKKHGIDNGLLPQCSKR